MKKQIDYSAARKSRLDEKIEQTMRREFSVPQEVEEAKNKAFAEIRSRAAQRQQEQTLGEDVRRIREEKQEYANKAAAQQTKHRKRRLWGFGKTAASLAAAAAVFSVICISNPALAENVPLVGHVFEELGKSLGFSGDYEKYATKLETEGAAAAESEGAFSENTAEASEASSESGATSENVPADSAYSKTVDGVTITLSEVYCNDEFLNISMLVQSEEPFPETMLGQNEQPIVSILEASGKFSYNENEIHALGNYLEGRFLDENTYAGVWRIDLLDTKFEYNGEGAGDYREIKIPEIFTADLSIPYFSGMLPIEQQTTPEMPQELLDEYHTGLEENGLGGMDMFDPDVYENLTEEQKEIEHDLWTQMYNKYYEMYPDAFGISPSKYTDWWFDGPWEFSIDVMKNLDDTVTKEIDLVDEEGAGVLSVTKTPFEISLEENNPNAKYVACVLDANGELLDNGLGGRMNVLAISDKDVSTVYIYLCDYIEYMDELKGYYWSEDYEENSKTKTFKDLLDERAVMKTEVSFGE